jgi:hypothetical protein
MTEPSKMRRHLVAALSITAILTIVPASVSQAEPVGEHHQVPATICNFDWHRGTWQIKRLIRCAALHWKVPGGPQMALYIANRESKFRPNAYNPSGCAGIYQHMLKYWPGRADAYGFPGWSAFNARANIIVTMEMVQRGGWGPWAG